MTTYRWGIEEQKWLELEVWNGKYGKIEHGSFPAFFIENCEYISPVTGKPIMNKHQRKEDLLRSGCVEAPSRAEMESTRARNEQRIQAESDRVVEQSVREVLNK